MILIDRYVPLYSRCTFRVMNSLLQELFTSQKHNCRCKPITNTVASVFLAFVASVFLAFVLLYKNNNLTSSGFRKACHSDVRLGQKRDFKCSTRILELLCFPLRDRNVQHELSKQKNYSQSSNRGACHE